jgi:hypothetical protein
LSSAKGVGIVEHREDIGLPAELEWELRTALDDIRRSVAKIERLIGELEAVLDSSNAASSTPPSTTSSSTTPQSTAPVSTPPETATSASTPPQSAGARSEVSSEPSIPGKRLRVVHAGGPSAFQPHEPAAATDVGSTPTRGNRSTLGPRRRAPLDVTRSTPGSLVATELALAGLSQEEIAKRLGRVLSTAQVAVALRGVFGD